jgi:hypothetical protein
LGPKSGLPVHSKFMVVPNAINGREGRILSTPESPYSQIDALARLYVQDRIDRIRFARRLHTLSSSKKGEFEKRITFLSVSNSPTGSPIRVGFLLFVYSFLRKRFLE